MLTKLETLSFVIGSQDDQIGRIFAHCSPIGLIIYFGKFFDYYKTSQNYLATFFKVMVTHWQKMILGYISGAFFINSSGHPVGSYKMAADLNE
jgi:hypothetical protein